MGICLFGYGDVFRIEWQVLGLMLLLAQTLSKFAIIKALFFAFFLNYKINNTQIYPFSVSI